MSFNIRNGHAQDGPNDWTLRRDLLFDVIRSADPDVIGTQEGFDFQIDQLRDALPMFDLLGVGRDDGRCEGEHCTLFFRSDRFHQQEHGTFWFSETPDTPGSRQWTPQHARICTWARLADTEGNAFILYNVHLDHESQVARELSVRLLLERVGRQATPSPVIILGDFNMQEDNPALAELTMTSAPSFQDTFRIAHPNDRLDGTFHGFAGTPNRERIDYILASNVFQVLEARILRDNMNGRYPSDHFPITASLRLGS